MNTADVMEQYRRLALLRMHAIRHGLRNGDGRVSFCVLVHFDAARQQTIVDVAALPPCAVRLYSDMLADVAGVVRADVMPLDLIAGNWDGTPSGDHENIDDMFFSDTPMLSHCVPSLLHARDLYEKAARTGHRWTGTIADLPRAMRGGVGL